VTSARIPEATKRAIFKDNLARLINRALEAKKS
jgi:hypothetical protein